MDCDLWRCPVSVDKPTTQARGVPIGPARDERHKGASRNIVMQSLLALPRHALRVGWNAGSLAEDLGHHGQTHEQWAG